MIDARHSRREVIRTAAASALFPALGVSSRSLAAEPPAGEPAPAESPASGLSEDGWRGLKAGVASYSLRKLPLDAALKGTRRVGLGHISLKDAHLPLDSTAEQRQSTGQQCRDAGVIPLSCGVITMENDEAMIRAAFEYARDLGVPTIVCNPHPDSMQILDKLVKEFDIRLAVHNHGPSDKRWPTPYEPLKAAEKYDERIGVCIDVGHTARAGVDPAEAIRRCAPRLYDLHLKDVNRADADGKDVEIGRGVLNIGAMLGALLEVRYAHHVGFEHEKDADDPFPGLAESVGYVRGILKGLGG